MHKLVIGASAAALLLLGSLAVTVLLVFAIVTDGEANAFEGAMLLGLYAIIGAAVWWGPAIGA